MRFILLLVYYIRWHYSRAFVDVYRIWTNILWFLWNFFSIGLLARTVFSPWRRLGEAHFRGEGLGKYFGKVIVNSIMRVIGFFMRSSIIISGMVVWLGALVVGACFFFIWVALPFITAAIIVVGFRYIFS